MIRYICGVSKQADVSLRTVQVTRYITPLREGGSLPAIVEADDGFLYALKFRGAGQGVKALIADVIGAETARALGFKVPELVYAMVDEAFGRTEPDEEIQDLLKASTGMNLGVHYLSGAINYDPAVDPLDPLLASKIVWLDCLLMNVDRTARNTNMLMWRKELWLIDHGAALYFHHNWQHWRETADKPFIQVRDHVLLPWATKLEEADALLKPLLTEERLRNIVALIPDDWLPGTGSEGSPAEQRSVYTQFLLTRLSHSSIFVNEAKHAATLI